MRHVVGLARFVRSGGLLAHPFCLRDELLARRDSSGAMGYWPTHFVLCDRLLACCISSEAMGSGPTQFVLCDRLLARSDGLLAQAIYFMRQVVGLTRFVGATGYWPAHKNHLARLVIGLPRRTCGSLLKVPWATVVTDCVWYCWCYFFPHSIATHQELSLSGPGPQIHRELAQTLRMGPRSCYILDSM